VYLFVDKSIILKWSLKIGSEILVPANKIMDFRVLKEAKNYLINRTTMNSSSSIIHE
jgi:hypothetical protein